MASSSQHKHKHKHKHQHQHQHQFFLSLLLVLYPFSAAAQTGPNITRGSSLSAQGNNPALWALSPAGDFAFGFVPLQPNQFLLAIWFAKITTSLTVVWSANRDPVEAGSKASLTSNGRLSLQDHNGQEIWSPGVGDVAHATMLDAGNLALMASDGTGYAWQSFDHPTDTILPTQVMNKGGLLSSRRSPSADDYSLGRFQLRLLPDGNLCLNTIALPTDHAYEAYWLTKGTLGTGSYLVFNQSSGIQEVQENSSLVNVTYANIGSPEDYYQRVTLDPDGVFRHYIYPKPSAGNKSYPDSWSVASFIPENICSAVIVEKGGSGACGFNSYCQFADNQKTCLCPERYSYVDPADNSKGCMPDFAEPRCDAYDSADFELTAMPNTNWTNTAYEWLGPMQEDECRQSCLDDCRCMVAISKDGDCLKKAMPLSGGRVDPGYGGKALFKIARVDSSPPPPPGLSRGRKSPPVIISAMLGSSAFVNILLISAIAILFLSSRRKRSPPAQIDSRTVGGHLQAFSYHTLEEATSKFGEILGNGAFGTVYKGVLTLGEAQVLVAVKKLDKLARDGEKEFRAEMNAIGRTHHKNLVQLLGFCDEGAHRLLVYEFMSNGSLASYLFGENRPGWDQRVQIAFGVARGLSYLHEECSSQIIHCDIKPENILLDACFTARISDFGLAKLLMREQTRTQTDIRGTKGYVAPEWFKKRAITAKVDVYSFGVMLLEIVCCRKNIELEFGSDAMVILTDWAYDCYSDKRLDFLVEHDEEARSNRRMLERLVAVALWCIQEEPSMRPSMKKVTQMLEGAVEVPVPPDPTSLLSSMY